MSTDYAPRDAVQQARFMAFAAECERLVDSARSESVVRFLRTLDIDAMRALYALAVEADATAIIGLIGTVAAEKGWQA